VGGEVIRGRIVSLPSGIGANVRDDGLIDLFDEYTGNTVIVTAPDVFQLLEIFRSQVLPLPLGVTGGSVSGSPPLVGQVSAPFFIAAGADPPVLTKGGGAACPVCGLPVEAGGMGPCHVGRCTCLRKPADPAGPHEARCFVGCGACGMAGEHRPDCAYQPPPEVTKGGGPYDKRHPFEECADDDLCNVCRGLWLDPIHGGEPPDVNKGGGALVPPAPGDAIDVAVDGHPGTWVGAVIETVGEVGFTYRAGLLRGEIAFGERERYRPTVNKGGGLVISECPICRKEHARILSAFGPWLCVDCRKPWTDDNPRPWQR